MLRSLLSIFNSGIEKQEWKRNLAVLSLAQFVAMIGMGASIPFLPLYIKDLGISDIAEAKIWSGWVFSGVYISSVITIPIWGVLGDRFGRKKMAIRAIFGLALSSALMGMATSVEQLFIFRIIQGALSGFIPASLAFVSANSPSNKVGYSIGILQSAIAAGNIVGPFIGGIVADYYGIREVFYIVAGLCLIAGFLVLIYLKEGNLPQAKQKRDTVWSNLSFVVSQKPTLIIFAMILVIQASVQFNIPILAFYLEEINTPKEYMATITGFMFGVIAIFSVLTATWWGKRADKDNWTKLLLVGSLVVGVMLLLHIVPSDYKWLFAIRAIVGIFSPALIPLLYTALNKYTPNDIKSGVMGIASAATLLGSLISFLLTGATAAFFGIESVFIISGTILILVGFVPIYLLKKEELGNEE